MYRTVDTTMWRDRWFSRLGPDARYLFVYLLTCESTNVAGCYEITVRQAAFDTGLTEDRVEALLGGDLAERVCWWPDHEVVFVRNYFRRQWGDKRSWQREEGARRAISSFPEEIRKTVEGEYPEMSRSRDTLSIGYPDPIDTVPVGHSVPIDTLGRTGTGTGTGIETGTGAATTSRVPACDDRTRDAFGGHAAAAVVPADAYITTLDKTFSKVAAKFVQLDPQFNRGWLAQAMRDAATKEVRQPIAHDALSDGMMNAYERIAESLANGRSGNGKGTRTGLARKIIFTALNEVAV